MNAPRPAPDTAALKAAHPIAEVVAGYGIALRPSGQALVGRCPFHADSGRPNLHVYPQTRSYYCFRCGQGGDVIDFVMRRERLGFRAACERLRARTPRPPSPGHAGGEPDWERLSPPQQRVLDLAMQVYRQTLWRTPRALGYLAGRGIGRELLGSGLLGYADGQSLGAAIALDQPALAELGLVRRDPRGRLVEHLAGRIVVAERRRGHARWCIGRAVLAAGPKYLGLPGPRPLLGLERVAGQPVIFLVEGVFDWLVALAWGLPACSFGGTHGSARQLQALAGAGRIYGVFDADAAGEEAAARLALHFGPRWRALTLPARCDLNDLALRPGGRQHFFTLLAAAQGESGGR